MPSYIMAQLRMMHHKQSALEKLFSIERGAMFFFGFPLESQKKSVTLQKNFCSHEEEPWIRCVTQEA